MPTPAVDLTPGDTYAYGPHVFTVTARPYTVPGCFGEDVLRIPVRDHNGVDTCDVVYPDHEVQKET
ncbi:hypothetical protein [Nocardiopsis sp. NRRL B-16309]|uniref:hypothetical protein n=1 Tax=Nocardiopsis sp. NRRL B-16309 TaxID=1519494 RepID=UPI0006AFB6BC|nr:hypothetical protein [Nocardiopsis sp. NRRL B-16309]KOX10119.1 hypothetical protein ADL05_25905 [Nocardiopsis sp. NRRL B-16309]